MTLDLTYQKQITDAIKQKREPMCIHEISADSGVKESSVSGLVYALEKNGTLVKCNEGQKRSCRWFGKDHFVWSYNDKEKMEAKRSFEVGQMLREEHQKALKTLRDEYEGKLETLRKSHAEQSVDKSLSHKIIDEVVLKHKLKIEMLRTRALAHILSDVLKERTLEGD